MCYEVLVIFFWILDYFLFEYWQLSHFQQNINKIFFFELFQWSTFEPFCTSLFMRFCTLQTQSCSTITTRCYRLTMLPTNNLYLLNSIKILLFFWYFSSVMFRKTQTCMYLSIAKLTKYHLTFHTIILSYIITTITLFIFILWIFFQNIDNLWILNIIFPTLTKWSIAMTK